MTLAEWVYTIQPSEITLSALYYKLAEEKWCHYIWQPPMLQQGQVQCRISCCPNHSSLICFASNQPEASSSFLLFFKPSNVLFLKHANYSSFRWNHVAPDQELNKRKSLKQTWVFVKKCSPTLWKCFIYCHVSYEQFEWFTHLWCMHQVNVTTVSRTAQNIKWVNS